MNNMLYMYVQQIMSYGWSLPKLAKFYPRIKFPGDAWGLNNGETDDGRRLFNIKTFIDANYNRYLMISIIYSIMLICSALFTQIIIL